MVLAVPIENEGQMSEVEALAILNVTVRRPKWLLSQVHPDKHPDFEAEATTVLSHLLGTDWCELARRFLN